MDTLYIYFFISLISAIKFLQIEYFNKNTIPLTLCAFFFVLINPTTLLLLAQTIQHGKCLIAAI